MNTEYLKTFLYLAESGNFSKTAKDLVIVQSTVSSRIRELEKEVGQKLFIRNHNYSELALAGRALLEYAEKIINLESQALDQINLASNYSDRLILGTVHSFYDYYLNEFISDFMKENTDIALRVVFGHSSRVLSSISQGRIDIGYSHYPLNHPGFICSLFSEDDLILVTGCHNQQYREGILVKDIKDLPIYYSNFLSDNTRNWLFPKNKLFQLDLDIGAKVIPFLKKGESYSFLPRKAVDHDIKNGTLIEIPTLDGELPPVPNYLIYKRESQKSNSIQRWLSRFRNIE